MSSLVDKFKMFVKTAKDVGTDIIEGNDVVASVEEQQRRLSICNDCPSLRKLGALRQCSICGCAVQVKAKLLSSQCPIDKWKEDESNS